MHRSMDGPNEEARPYCSTCKTWFRKWGWSTRKHRKDNPTHVLVTKFVRTR